jgi:ribulose-5-phosphate 4-epimerase/fuculose-1-phosphate aldolase
MHLHTTAAQAVCCLREGLAFSNFYAAQLYGKLAYHDFEGITVHLEEGQRILASAGGKPVLLLRNHGPVTVGANVAQAFSLMWLVQRACEVQLATQSMGEAVPIPTHVLEKCVADSLQFDPRFGAGQDAFDALQRLVDRVDPGYRR